MHLSVMHLSVMHLSVMHLSVFECICMHRVHVHHVSSLGLCSYLQVSFIVFVECLHVQHVFVTDIFLC